ncbi:hypothetical protein [Gordonia sp. ABSL49_1]|uniref:hypothetical protein n=1 Tax=Gordonia sp. ABSL49_1 TaxID=2920941 RepID=UPI001F1042BF|nr:hypothetical protein [Gordonia sp. ABSL49_1]MCH5641431.1 hypothetical protein [Gordonia sp. ABSL49_1]
MTAKPCIVCGTPAFGTRCPDHRLPDHQPPASARGYDTAWRKLSARARRLQPFCSDCGAVDDLQADHSPEAWQRKAAGKTIRLQDIDVVCGPCNRTRGAARTNGKLLTRGDAPTEADHYRAAKPQRAMKAGADALG